MQLDPLGAVLEFSAGIIIGFVAAVVAQIVIKITLVTAAFGYVLAKYYNINIPFIPDNFSTEVTIPDWGTDNIIGQIFAISVAHIPILTGFAIGFTWGLLDG